MLTEKDVNRLINQMASEFGYVGELSSSLSDNTKDFFVLAGCFMERLNNVNGIDIDPMEILPNLYTICKDPEVNQDGTIKGLYLDIISDSIILDVVLGKAGKTDFPNTFVYNVYGLNLFEPKFSEYGTAYLYKNRNGELHHIDHPWDGIMNDYSDSSNEKYEDQDIAKELNLSGMTFFEGFTPKTFEVGKEFPLTYKMNNDYSTFDFLPDPLGAAYFVFYNNPTPKEIADFTNGEVKFAIKYDSPVINVLWKVKDSIGPCSFNSQISSASFQHFEHLHIMLVDSSTGIIKAMRSCAMTENFSNELYAAIDNQRNLNYSNEEFYDKTMMNQTDEDIKFLWKSADVYMKIDKI